MIKFLKNTNDVWKKVAGILLFFMLFSTTLTVFSSPPTTKYLPGATLDPNCAPGDTNCTTAVAPAMINFTTIDDGDSPYSVLSTDQIIYADSSSGDVNIVLPQLSSITETRKITILKTSLENVVTVDAYLGDYINETTTVFLTSNRKGFVLESVRANQWIATPNFDDLIVAPTIVRVGTNGEITGVTYDNGSGGVGATLTKSTNGTLPTINEISSFQTGDRILLRNQADEIQNGVYQVTDLGSVSTPYILTRATDSDESSELYPQIVIASEGGNWTVKGKQWVQEIDSPTLGTSDISYTSITPSTFVTQSSVGTQQAGQIAFWTSNAGQKQLSKGVAELFWDSASYLFGIGTSAPNADLDVASFGGGDYVFRASNDSSSASDYGQIYLDTDGVVSLNTGNGEGGINEGSSGSNMFLATGAGGEAINTSNPAKNGGSFSLITGAGGLGFMNPGIGGAISLITGNGSLGQAFCSGICAGSDSPGVGGGGGALSFLAGNGGAGADSDAPGSDGEGGDGGSITFNPGAGGTGNGSNGSDGNIVLANLRGLVGIGTTPTSNKLEVANDSASAYTASFLNDGNNANRYGLKVQAGADDASGTTYYFDAYDGDGGQVGYIANTNGTFALTDVSDIKTKTNIEDTNVAGLDVVNSLNVVDFNRKQDSGGKKITGFIAQDVFEVYPDAITESSGGLLGIMKDAFIPVLVKAVQELNGKVDSMSVIGSVISAPFEIFTEYLESSVEKVINGVVNFIEIISEKITTKKLCVEDICVTRSEFLQLLEQNNISPVIDGDFGNDDQDEGVDSIDSGNEGDGTEGGLDTESEGGDMGGDDENTEGDLDTEGEDDDLGADDENPEGEVLGDQFDPEGEDQSGNTEDENPIEDEPEITPPSDDIVPENTDGNL